MEIEEKARNMLGRKTGKEEGRDYKLYARKEAARIAIFPICCAIYRVNDGLNAPLGHKYTVKLKH